MPISAERSLGMFRERGGGWSAPNNEYLAHFKMRRKLFINHRILLNRVRLVCHPCGGPRVGRCGVNFPPKL